MKSLGIRAFSKPNDAVLACVKSEGYEPQVEYGVKCDRTVIGSTRCHGKEAGSTLVG